MKFETPRFSWEASHKNFLISIIKERSMSHGHFVLSSGLKTETYFNMKATIMYPSAIHKIVFHIIDFAKENKIDYIGGLALGPIPILGAISASEEFGYLRTFFVRQKTKDYGTKELIEGLAPQETLENKKVLIIDDVATTGGSILQATKAVRDAGGIVEKAIVIVDREKGATEFLQQHNVTLYSMIDEHEFS